MFISRSDHFVVAHGATRLDDGCDAVFRGHVETIAEREEGIAGHHGALYLELLVSGLHGGNAAGDHAAHLACTHTKGLRVLRVDDGIGLHELRHAPRKEQVFEFARAGLALRNDLQFRQRHGAFVAVLHEQATTDGTHLQARRCACSEVAGDEHAHVLLGAGDGECFIRGRRRDDDFDELTRGDGGGSFGIERAIEGDDAAERRGGVRDIGAFIRRERRDGHRHATGIGVLHDDAGRRFELAHAFQRGVCIGDVVETQFLALQLARGSHAHAPRDGIGVERGGLVRVLAVAQVQFLHGAQFQRFGELLRLAALLRHPVRHHRVVAAGVRVGLGGQALAQREAGAAGRDGDRHFRVVGRVHDDSHVFVVLGRTAHHGRPADVDVLDAVIVGAVGLGHRGGEGVEVHYQQIDGRDAVFGHHGVVDATTAEQSTVHLRVQCLHAAVHHLGETRMGGHFRHWQAGACEQLRGAAGAEQRNASSMQCLCEFQHAGFVRNRKQGAPYGHGWCGFSRQDRIPSAFCGACRD